MRCDEDIVFQGHEHKVHTTRQDELLISKGGEFSAAFTHKSTFSAVVLNTDSFDVAETKFMWNASEGMFCSYGDTQTFTITPKSNNPKPNDVFINGLYEDVQKLAKNVLDYFTFPKLYCDKINSSDTTDSISEDLLWGVLLRKKKINILGKRKSGKTTLAKYLYNQCIEKGMFPLYLEKDSVPVKNIDEVIKVLFSEQYGKSSVLWNKFQQTDSSKKILIVDDLDLITRSQKLIEVATEYCDYIIFTSQDQIKMDVVKMSKENLVESEEALVIEIGDFYKEERTKLVSGICKINKVTSERQDLIIKIIDGLAERKNGLFELSPEYIINYIKYFLNEKNETNGEAVFNLVFQTNLINAILEHSSEQNIDYCMVVLEEIAFYMHKNKKERISYQEIIQLINNSNSELGLDIDIEKCLNNILKASIIKKSSITNMYEFGNRNHLAYFIASKLNKLIEKGQRGLDVPELQYIFKNICFGINDTILMFLSFIRKNTTFALNICDHLESIVSEYPELCFEQGNVGFITRNRNSSVISMPTQSDKAMYEKNKAAIEEGQRKVDSDALQYKSIYDYNESDANNFDNKIVRAIKYLEIVSKSLISHFMLLNKDEKDKLITQMYSATNRILFAMFSPYDKHFDKVIDELKDFIDSLEDVEGVSREHIEEVVIQTTINICLKLYDKVAFFGANSNTLRLLNGVDKINYNYKIMNLIMEENGGTSLSFAEKAIKLKNDENDLFITSLIQRVARKHLITRTVDFKIKDKMADTLFPKSSKKAILTSSLKKAKNE